MTMKITQGGAVLAGLFMACVASPSVADDCVGDPGPARLRIMVEGVRTGEGVMTATLYPDAQDKFLKANGQLAVWRVPAAAPVTTMCLRLAAPGRYALAIYDDINLNGRFDHTTFSPREPYGFSNNPHPFFILPSVRSVTFTAGSGDTTLHIHLTYPEGIGDR
jgi:uncharacterized protein (DUF2141 family)